MRRRDVLRVAGSALALSSVGVPVRGESKSFEPLGTVSVEGASESVVSEDGSVAYVAATSGFATVDVSDPTDPTVLAEVRDILADRATGPLGDILDVKVDGDRLAVAGPASPDPDALYGFALYDVSDPAEPERVAFFETPFPNHNCFFQDDIVYLTGNNYDNNPLLMVDVSDDDPQEVGSWSLEDYDESWDDVNWFLRVVHDVWVQDGIAYLPMWDAGTWIVDVSDPADPQVVGSFRSDRQAELASLTEDQEIRAESVEPPGNDHYVQVNEDASILALSMESWDYRDTQGGGPSGVELWDISDPTAAERLALIDPPSSPEPTMSGVWTTSHNLDIVDDRLYTSWYQGGVKVFDVSDPASPTELADWNEMAHTAFWTAKLARSSTGSEQGFFISSSYGVSDGVEEALYTFPDPAPDAGKSQAGGTEGGGATDGGTGGDGNSLAGGQPGFGPLAGLAGLVGGTWWHLRER